MSWRLIWQYKWRQQQQLTIGNVNCDGFDNNVDDGNGNDDDDGNVNGNSDDDGNGSGRGDALLFDIHWVELSKQKYLQLHSF